MCLFLFIISVIMEFIRIFAIVINNANYGILF